MKSYLKDDTVSIHGLCPEMIIAMLTVQNVFFFLQVDFVITSGCEDTARHMAESKHYTYEAIDCRSRDLVSQSKKILAFDMIRLSLGVDFDVVLESDHIHIEYDPKDKPS